MYRISKMSGTYYAKRISDFTNDSNSEDIQSLIDDGEPVILVNDLSDLENLDINPEEVEEV